MAVQISLNTPLANALGALIQPKLLEVGWGTGGTDDALAEYIILMLVNGKTQDEIASELSGDLLNLGPDDPGARDFSKWLFDQVASLSGQPNNGSADGAPTDNGTATTMDHSLGDMDTDMSALNDGSEINA
jgi:nuclear polyadenylated RNA-binding protein NAB2